MSTEIKQINGNLPDRDQVKELATRIKRFMPGGNRLTNEQALSGAQIVLSRGLDPFRDAYVYPDNRGNIVVKEKYTVNIKWAQRISPYNRRFARIVDIAADEESLEEGDIAYYCYLMRTDKIPELSSLTQAGYPVEIALQMVESRGIGVVTAFEISKRKKPPQGWTWARVAQKRAEADAIRLAYGEPSPEELRAQRYSVEGIEVLGIDYEDTEHLAPGDARALAKARAQQREPVLEDEQLPDAQAALYGGDIVDGDYSETPPLPPTDDGPDFEDGSPERPQDGGIDPAVLAAMATEAQDDAPPDGCKWGEFFKAAISKLGYDDMSHVIATLEKETDHQRPFHHQTGEHVGKIAYDSKFMWNALINHQKGKVSGGNPGKGDVKL